MAHAVIEVCEKETLRVDVYRGVHYTSDLVLESARDKEVATRLRSQAALLTNSLIHFIGGAVENGRTKENVPEISRLEKLKANRFIQRSRLRSSRAFCCEVQSSVRIWFE